MRVLSVTLLLLLACALSSAHNGKLQTTLLLDKTVLKYVFKHENKILVCGAGTSAEVLFNILIHVSLLKKIHKMLHLISTGSLSVC